MLETLQETSHFWRVVTHLGSSSLLLPLLALMAAGLWRSGQAPALKIWLKALALAAILTLATKIAFLGWGFGIVSLDFTGISGHTLGAAAVLPVVFGWLPARAGQCYRPAGAAFGVLLATAVGVSRIVLDTHSPSEVAAAGLVGLLVSGLALTALQESPSRPRFARLAPLILLLAFDTNTSTYLPTHDLEIRMAMLLSGRDSPFQRHHLHRPTAASNPPLARTNAPPPDLGAARPPTVSRRV